MRRKSNTFYCFSPPVMIATFIIEICLVFYTLFRYQHTLLARLLMSGLLFLSLFQFSEYFVCTTDSTTGLFARLGFISITMLPPLGVHIVQTIAGRGSKWLPRAAYLTAALAIGFFAFNSGAFTSYECSGNYSIFHLMKNINILYGAYYYFWLATGIYLCFRFAKDATPKIRAGLMYQAYGYLSFVIPTGLVLLADPVTTRGIPSIMCGFAVIYALIMALGIAPLMLEKRTSQL